jgi:hypothetical protein
MVRKRCSYSVIVLGMREDFRAVFGFGSIY